MLLFYFFLLRNLKNEEGACAVLVKSNTLFYCPLVFPYLVNLRSISQTRKS